MQTTTMHRLVHHPKRLEMLESALDFWGMTPHIDGQREPGPGGGVDCVGLVASVLDSVYTGSGLGGVLRGDAEPPRVARDAGVHTGGRDALEREEEGGIVRWFRRRYPAQVVFDDPAGAVLGAGDDPSRVLLRIVRAGDVLVFRSRVASRAVNHVGIAGAFPGSVWHAPGNGAAVCRASLHDQALARLARAVYRPLTEWPEEASHGR